MTISPDYTTEPHQSPLTSLTLAGFVFITGFATVLERFGIGGRVILHAELALVLTALCAMAWFCRTMELKRFFIPFTTSVPCYDCCSGWDTEKKQHGRLTKRV